MRLSLRGGPLVAIRGAACAILAIALYYLVPLDVREGPTTVAVRAAMFLVGAAVLVAFIVLLIRRHLRGDAGLEALLVAFYLVIGLFAAVYVVLSRIPGEFEGLHTRTDALYFTVTVLATIGFGDVHAVGQVARAVVMLQIVFDLVFVAAAVAAVSGRLRDLAAARTRSRSRT
ncbi:MAG: ion channel [Streptomycetales bacterium]